MAKYNYQTEVGELLHLMTHSLYSNKEIFLRELISNSNDAIDKFNYLKLTDERFKDEDWSGKITIKLDKEDNSISVIDNGIGMNEQDLIDNLGTIAKSGTRTFLEQLGDDAKKTNNLIGQSWSWILLCFLWLELKWMLITKRLERMKLINSVSQWATGCNFGELNLSWLKKDEHRKLSALQ